jgi:hypothetical protein
MKSTLLALIVLLAAGTGKAVTYAWTNTLGGDWSVAANWSSHVVPGAGDSVLITNNGNYTVTILTSSVTLSNLTLGGSTGVQTLLNGTANTLATTNLGMVNANGVLTLTNGGISGKLSIAAGAHLNLSSSNSIYIDNLSLTNRGTVTWSGAHLDMGSTFITNSGVWQITGDSSMYQDVGLLSVFGNSGTLSKTAGTGISSLSGII